MDSSEKWGLKRSLILAFLGYLIFYICDPRKQQKGLIQSLMSSPEIRNNMPI